MKKQINKFILQLSIFLCIGAIHGQNIKGVVSDTTGPLPGVNVIVKGTSQGTETSIDGEYQLSGVPPNGTLVFSFIGYKTIEIPINGKSNINVSLEEDLATLEEVVVVGYGTKKKSLVTGAISSIDSKQIQSVSTQRVDQVLQGRTSGVTVSSSSGSPGSGVQIRIRGTGSSGASAPLFIVDGMKVSSIDNIPPSDIANIEVLKDAASSAIYGTEGANGVVIVTTKKGTSERLKINFNSQFGIQFLNSGIELMNAEQFVNYMAEAGQLGIEDNGYDTNWINATFSDAPMYRYDISLSGTLGKTNYYFSASKNGQDGILAKENSSFKRHAFRFNLKSEIAEWFEVGLNTSASLINRTGVIENDAFSGVIQHALVIDPLTPVTYSGATPTNVRDLANEFGVPLLTDKRGRVYGYPSYSTGEVMNPLANASANRNLDDRDNFLSTIYGKFNILEGLSFTSRFGYEIIDSHIQEHKDPYYVSPEAQNTAYSASDLKWKSKRWLWENFASYNKSFGDHNITVLAGYSAEEIRGEVLSNRSGSTPVDQFTGFDLDLPEYSVIDLTPNAFSGRENIIDINGQTIIGKDNMVSMYGRLSYDFKNKYLLEGSIRRDKSSKFPQGKKVGIFPAISAGWVVSNEGFWSDNAKLNYLKFRGSWGQNGSKSNLNGNSDLTVFIQFLGSNPIDYLGYSGAEISVISNDQLIWETSEQMNVGIDLKAFNSKLNFSVDYYEKTTNDLIVEDGSLATPESVGLSSAEFNAGTILNKGLEFEVGFGETKENGFSYQINANLSTLENEVTEILFLPEGTAIVGAEAPQNENDGVTRFSKGLPAWYFYGYETLGINPISGEILIKDVNNDGLINNNDKTMIGSPHPEFLYGGNIRLAYDVIDFNVQFQGSYGNDIFAAYHQPTRPITNKPVHFYNNRWQQGGDIATFPGAASVAQSYQTDLMVEDGSFMRIKQIQLGYTLPSRTAEQLRLDNLRIYVSLDDLFTFTDFSGLDPEIGNFGFNEIGVDRGYYPTAAKAIFGLSLNF